MTTQTLSKTEAPVLPELDRPDAAQIGDEILMASAAATKVRRVRTGTGPSESRAWTQSGSVD